MRADERRRLLALSDERDRWAAYAADCFRQGVAAGEAHSGGEGFNIYDLMNARAAGRRDAYASAAGRFLPAFDAGVAACLERFADLIGGRAYPPRDTPPPIETVRWTRHHPACRIAANGRRPCKRLGCLPGLREDFGKPAPWDVWPEGGGGD